LNSLINRRSALDFEAIAEQDLATWLYYCSSIQSVNQLDENRRRGFTASFGALHAVHLLIGRPDGTWNVYLEERHSLGVVPVREENASALRENADSYHSGNNATLVVLVANIDLASAYYEQFDSLLLREAGVILGHAALVSSGLGLSFRILGGNGSPWALTMLQSIPFTARAIGMAWIGARQKASRDGPLATDETYS